MRSTYLAIILIQEAVYELSIGTKIGDLDLERRNGHYCVLSYRILQSCQALSCSWSWRFLVLVLVFVLTYMVLFNNVWSFVPSLLRAGVQPTLDPSAETFMSVQCASPGRGGEVCAVYVRVV